ncbi:S9 family peptidase [Crocinitomicaceae bacterium]|nr:S9 family peptidase [Crocinitomicaceae bacterium]MDC0257600.1 S9 family peptidase [Crocinitomicaceae bacterium]
MKKLLLGFVTLTISLQGFAQQELTLEQSTSGFRSLVPESILDFQWMMDSKCYTQLAADYQSILKGTATGDEMETLLTLADFNKIAGVEFRHMYGVQWKDDSKFWLSQGGKYVEFDISNNTAKTLVELPEGVENPSQSDAVGHVAYTLDNNVRILGVDGMTHSVTEIEDPNIVSGQAIARSEFGITQGFFWSPNGSQLAFYQKDESNVADYPLLDNSTTPGTLRNIKYPMAGQGSEKARVGIYNLSSKKLVYFKTRNGSENYLTNVSWTPDSKFVLVAEVNRNQDQLWLNVYDAASGKYVKTLLEEKSETWVEPEHPAFFPEDDSYNFVWISEKDGFNNLYYYNFEGELIKKLTEHDFVVNNIIDYVEGRIYYQTTGETPIESHVYSVDLKGKVKILTRANGTHSVDISPDAKYFHDNFSSQKVSNNHWILDGRGKIVTKKLEAESKLDAYTIGTIEIITIEAKDGSKLYTRMIKPSDFDPNKKYPVLVYVYGGPHAQMITDSWSTGASGWMLWMAEQGYIIYTVDNRGSANRGKAFEEQIHRQVGTVEIEDQMTGVAYLKSLPYVDADRLAVHGWSFGGFMTTSLMLRQPGTFNVGVAGGPVTDWKYYEIMYGERYMDQPDQNPEGYKQASLFTHAENLEGDLMLIHGTVDDVVVMQHSLSLVETFVKAGIQMDFFPYPMHPHNVRGKDRDHLMRKVLEYVMENNQ